MAQVKIADEKWEDMKVPPAPRQASDAGGTETTTLAKPEPKETALADLAEAFGGKDAAVPTDIAWPEIKLTKEDEFKMPDGTKAKKVVGFIAFAKRSRSFWRGDYDGQDNPPDCASANCHHPSSGDDIQSETCATCKQADWRVVEKDGKDKNVMPCSESLNVIFLEDGKALPRFMRIRSTSMSKKSSIAAFFANCLETDYALKGKFQTVQVKLTLKETKIGGYDTSILIVEKLDVLSEDDPLLNVLIDLFNKAQQEFVVTHTRGDNGQSAAPPVDVDVDVDFDADAGDYAPF